MSTAIISGPEYNHVRALWGMASKIKFAENDHGKDSRLIFSELKDLEQKI